MYRPGKQNAAADALSRKSKDLTTQKAIQEDYRTLTLLPPEKVDPRVLGELESLPPGEPADVTPLAAVTVAVGEAPPQGYVLVDQILQANKASESLESFRELARVGQSDWQLRDDGLLTKAGCLVVPADGNLRTYLLMEFHNPMPTAHPGRNKMRDLVKRQYYWSGMTSDIDTFVSNCLICRRSHVPRDKPPSLLKSLEVPARPWQHVTMDFHSLNKDRYGYDQVFVVVDRLGKRAYSLPCYKSTTAKDIANLYYRHI